MDKEIEKIQVSYQETGRKRIIERQKNPADISYTFENQVTGERYFIQEVNGNPHFSPGSVLIATIGTDFPDGCKEKIYAMKEYTREAGYNVKYVEMQVYHNTFPQASHASTRNHAINSGRIGGTDYICFLDTDVEPEKEILVNLLEHQMSVITPYVIDPDDNSQLGAPSRNIATGLYIQKWVPQCFLLVKTGVFHNTEIKFAYDEAEDMFSQRLHLYGLTRYVDTGQVLTLASPPGRPDSKSWKSRMDALEERYDRVPNRMLSETESKDVQIKEEFLSKLGLSDKPNVLMVKDEENNNG